MNEFDSPNYTEYTYDKKAEGKTLLLKWILILGYILFVALFFLACYITRIIPLFAVCPVVTWIIVYFSWRLVKYDVYYTFEHGHMEFGRIRESKSGKRRSPRLRLDVQHAYCVLPYCEATDSEEYKGIRILHDYASRRNHPSLAVIIFEGKRGREAVVFDTIPKLSRLLGKYCPNIRNLA